MNSSFASSYKRQTYTEITKESLNESILNHKLSLRKVKLENKLMEKRTMSLSRESSHQINLNELNFPEEIAKDVNNYIRSKFDIKSIFSYLFSDDLLQKLPRLLLDDDIDIHEVHSQSLRQQYPDGRLAAGWHSDHRNIHSVSSLFCYNV